MVRQGKEVAPGAFGPPAPGALLWPAFLGQEADTPSFPTPEREATERASQRQQEMTEKDKTGREVRTTANLEQLRWAQWFVLSFSEKNYDQTTRDRFIQVKLLGSGMRADGFSLLQRFLTGTDCSTQNFLLQAWKENHKERDMLRHVIKHEGTVGWAAFVAKSKAVSWSVVLFIHLDCFGVRNPVLETSAFSWLCLS